VSHTPRILITSGEPAGIGPDLCLAIAQQSWARDCNLCEIVFAGDRDVFAQRAAQLNIEFQLTANQSLLHVPTAAPVVPGKLDARNAAYVLALLDAAAQGCLNGEFDAIVTAPIQKSVINDAGIPFTGHTEYFADKTQTPLPVMMLVADELRVALVTTHLPLNQVSQAITGELLAKIIVILDHDLRLRFGIDKPRIMVCGLNPHAGENGYLGREEIEVITPTLNALRECKIYVIGPVPADTAFTPKQLAQADCVLAMYHDQGLPTLKYAGFGHAVNVTLGLPIIRTSVDHGTALDLAGTGKADAGSLEAALRLAIQLAGRQDRVSSDG
jgi:4-hydroxythreonine-4-phosphate dehydrogenase